MKTITIPTLLTTAALALATAGCAGGAGPDLAAVAPCDLLTPAQLADAGLGAGRPEDAGPVRTCTWTPDGAGPGERTVLMVMPAATLDELQSLPMVAGGGEYVDGEVAGRPALVRSSGPGCMTVVDVGSGLLAVIGADSCDRQRGMAEHAVAGLSA